MEKDDFDWDDYINTAGMGPRLLPVQATELLGGIGSTMLRSLLVAAPGDIPEEYACSPEEAAVALACCDLAELPAWDETALIDAATVGGNEEERVMWGHESRDRLARRISLVMKAEKAPEVMSPADGVLLLRRAGINVFHQLLDAVAWLQLGSDATLPNYQLLKGIAEPQKTAPATQATTPGPAPKVTSTLFDSGLSVREFKTHLLNVPDLLEWAKSKRFHLRTTPPLDGYEFVHIETLLCAIERHAMSLTHEQARDIVANDPALQSRSFAEVGLSDEALEAFTARLNESPAWLVQADAHSQWRKLFAAAIQAGELVLLDFGSKLPIDTAPTTQAAPVVAVGASNGLEPAKTGPANALQRTAAQDAAILCEIAKQGYDPLALPKNPPGKPGAKAVIRTALSKNPLFTGKTVFGKAWERLTAHADIVIQG